VTLGREHGQEERQDGSLKMHKAAEYWKKKADEVRAIADGMEFEKQSA
jgi:hypothetical protein